jgi:D-ribulokinase
MNQSLYIGVDIGTQSAKVLAASDTGEIVASASRPLTSTRSGDHHQQDPKQWWDAVCQASREVSSCFHPGYQVRGIAVDATSGTILLADKDGNALTPGLMYDDGRARAEAAEVNDKGAGLWSHLSYHIQPSWALPKLLWLLRHTSVPAGARLLHQNDWINLRLSSRFLPSDSSHALKTGYDLIGSRWPSELMQVLGVPQSILPEVVRPATRIGEVSFDASRETGLPAGTPILAGMTDGCAAQIASGSMEMGSWSSVIGTTLVVKGVTRSLLHDPSGVIYSHRSPDGLWLPGGASNTGAGAIAAAFAHAQLDHMNCDAELHGPTPLVVYPLLARGERFPFAAPDATGFTLGRAATPEERYRGILQGIALWERLCFDALRSLGSSTCGTFSILGGATQSHALNWMRADVLERELIIPAVTESAFGMAVLVAASESSLSLATRRMVRPGTSILPRRPFAHYAKQYAQLVVELNRRGWLPERLFQAASVEVYA